MFEIFFAPLQLFNWRPDRIAVVGIAILVFVAWLYYVRRQVAWSAVLIAQLWFAFAAWESHAKAAKWNIRVDLIIVWPVLLAATICGIAWSFRRERSLNLRSMLALVTIFCVVIGLGMMAWRARVERTREEYRRQQLQSSPVTPARRVALDLDPVSRSDGKHRFAVNSLPPFYFRPVASCGFAAQGREPEPPAT